MKVFSKDLYVRDVLVEVGELIKDNEIELALKLIASTLQSIDCGWVNEIDGLTPDQIKKLGYEYHNDWLIEVNEKEVIR